MEEFNEIGKGLEVSNTMLAPYSKLGQLVTDGRLLSSLGLETIRLPPTQTLGEAEWGTLRGDCSEYTPQEMLEYLEHHRLARRRRSGNYLGEQDRPSLGMDS